MGILTKGDSKLYRNWFIEMARLRGFTVKYYAVKNGIDSTMYGELNPNDLESPIDLDVIYEENPKRNTLKNIGWVSENPDDKPYIMIFPYNTPNISIEARIKIPQDVENLAFDKFKEFKITSISTIIEYPDCYTCTIVPVFQSDRIKNDYSNNNFNYIKEE